MLLGGNHSSIIDQQTQQPSTLLRKRKILICRYVRISPHSGSSEHVKWFLHQSWGNFIYFLTAPLEVYSKSIIVLGRIKRLIKVKLGINLYRIYRLNIINWIKYFQLHRFANGIWFSLFVTIHKFKVSFLTASWLVSHIVKVCNQPAKRNSDFNLEQFT